MIPADTQHLRETLLSRREVHQGPLLRLYDDEVGFPSGRSGRRDVIEHPGAVAIVATTATGEVVLVRQWRHAVGKALWELPAGCREPGEDPRLSAERELSEETGYSASSWVDLGGHFVAPGYSTEVIYFFRAEGLRGGDVHPDEDETLDIGEFAGPDLHGLIAAGDVDIKTIAGLALAGIAING